MNGRMRLRSKLGIALAAAAVIFAVLGVVAVAATRFERYDASGPRPTWAAVCHRNVPRADRTLLAHCARATGVVGWIREEGSGASHEVHFALLGRFGIVIVKLGDPSRLETPSHGHRVTAVGALVRASNGMREIQAWEIG